MAKALGSGMNYYERHIGDYLKDTAHLSLLEHGVYTRLLDIYYTREAGFSEQEAARLIGARSREDKAALGSVLDEFFKLEDGIYVQARAEREIAKLGDKRRKASASASARWDAVRAQSERTANASETHMRADSERTANALPTQYEGNARAPVPSLQTPDTIPKDKDPPAARVPQKPKPSKRCPESFAVDSDLADWAKQNAPGVDVVRETVKFRNHEFSNAKSDWTATWRNWMLESFDRGLHVRGNGSAGEPQWVKDRKAAVAAYGGAPRKIGQIVDMEEPNATPKKVG